MARPRGPRVASLAARSTRRSPLGGLASLDLQLPARSSGDPPSGRVARLAASPLAQFEALPGSRFTSFTVRPFGGLPAVGRPGRAARLACRRSLRSLLAGRCRSPLAARRSLAHGSLRSPFARPAALAPLVPPGSRLAPPARPFGGLPAVGRPARVSSVAPLPPPARSSGGLPTVAPPGSRVVGRSAPCSRLVPLTARDSEALAPLAPGTSRSLVRLRSLARGSLRSPLAHPAASLRSAARVAPPGRRVSSCRTCRSPPRGRCRSPRATRRASPRVRFRLRRRS